MGMHEMDIVLGKCVSNPILLVILKNFVVEKSP